MPSVTGTTRRDALKGGIATVAAVGAVTHAAHAAMPGDIPKKKAGETRVLFLGGDQLHNFAAQEPALRRICESAGWNFLSVHDARFVTPELLATVDLFIVQRWDGGLQGWVPGPIFETAPPNDGFMSDELEAAICDNVRTRGMGLMSLHCTVAATWTKPEFCKLIGVYGIIHGPLQALRIHNFNQNHPITAGMKDFELALDENFGAEIINDHAVPLYETTGYLDKRHDVGGWALEEGRGRIVGLLAGHTYFAYRDSNYLPLYWRGAHWALGRDIPPYKG